MRKHLLLIAMIFLTGVASAGVVKKTYTFDNPQVKKQGDYSMVHLVGTMNTGIAGEPALPYQPVNLMLEPGQIVDYVEIIAEGEVFLEGEYEVYPAQYSRPLSEKGESEFVKDEVIYTSSDVYPKESKGKFTTEFMNGYGFAMGTFTPVKYIAATKSVSYYSNVTVVVHTRNDESADRAMNHVKSSSSVLKRVQKLAQNPEMVTVYPQSRDYSDGYEILIITDHSFTDKFDELVEVYAERGYRTQIVSTLDVYSSAGGVDSPEQIRNYIIQEYQDHGIEHVVLGGDVEYIPYRGFFCSVQSSSVYEDDNIPSDLYYSALDGTWNDDGDDLWGEIDEDDLLPDVSVGRMSFSTGDELNKMLNKTINYQNNPVLGELRQPLLAGEHLWSDPLTYGSDYLDLHIGLHDDNDYTTQGMPEIYGFHKLYASEANWTSQDLMDRVNEGRNFLYHVGHANSYTVMNLYTEDITNENFSGANGVDHTFTVIYTHGCICGSFDEDDCIAEHMVKIDNFAAAFIGNSRYGWFNEGQTEGPSQHIHREFTDAVFGSKVSCIGAAHAESKAETSTWVNAPGQWEEGAQRWCFYDCNVLGDPVMSMWTSEPVDVVAEFNQSIEVGDTQLDVSLSASNGDVDGLRCAVMMDDVLIGYGLTDENGDAVVEYFEEVTEIGISRLVVSGYNCKPTSFDIYDNVGLTQADLPSFEMYPNPAKDFVYIKYDQGSEIRIETIEGQLVYEKDFVNSGSVAHRINTSQFKPGLYLITVSTPQGRHTQRLIKN